MTEKWWEDDREVRIVFTVIHLCRGNDNVAGINLSGSTNSSDIQQFGDSNNAIIDVIGDSNDLFVDQSGNENELLITSDQAVAANAIAVEQNGDINLVDMLIAGNSNSLDIIQSGSGNWVAGDNGYFSFQGETIGILHRNSVFDGKILIFWNSMLSRESDFGYVS